MQRIRHKTKHKPFGFSHHLFHCLKENLVLIYPKKKEECEASRKFNFGCTPSDMTDDEVHLVNGNFTSIISFPE
ncbi:CLUMA_CG019881, isoform A [Clunio marinus]|uniref:CLUMA_CG019881, isoform A n=1 Tax=Clunio marinus TaxID=568069 RepID=A0A1J1J5M6_9DIPT|nr:CLUMA_CG019881, isoform A [Clunio marinus]